MCRHSKASLFYVMETRKMARADTPDQLSVNGGNASLMGVHCSAGFHKTEKYRTERKPHV